jgi:hypothetical protein
LDESHDGSRKVKVVDRRKFTADGQPREPKRAARPPAEQPPPERAQPRAEQQVASDSVGSAGATEESSPSPSPETSSHFLGLVAMLVQHAELLIMGAEGLPPRPEEARTVIDFLGALEEKTAGNLTKDEHQALTSVLYQLRSLYVQKKP